VSKTFTVRGRPTIWRTLRTDGGLNRGLHHFADRPYDCDECPETSRINEWHELEGGNNRLPHFHSTNCLPETLTATLSRLPIGRHTTPALVWSNVMLVPGSFSSADDICISLSVYVAAAANHAHPGPYGPPYLDVRQPAARGHGRLPDSGPSFTASIRPHRGAPHRWCRLYLHHRRPSKQAPQARSRFPRRPPA
jgi:hypothetical protein